MLLSELSSWQLGCSQHWLTAPLATPTTTTATNNHTGHILLLANHRQGHKRHEARSQHDEKALTFMLFYLILFIHTHLYIYISWQMYSILKSTVWLHVINLKYIEYTHTKQDYDLLYIYIYNCLLCVLYYIMLHIHTYST